MRKFFIVLSFFILVFLINNSFSEIERSLEEIKLEIKILEKISKDITDKNKINVYLIDYNPRLLIRYSTSFVLVKDCGKADIIIAKTNSKEDLKMCHNVPGIALNYSLLKENKIFIGALFWYKGRPNLVFIKSRLERFKIDLPESYSRYIEEQLW